MITASASTPYPASGSASTSVTNPVAATSVAGARILRLHATLPVTATDDTIASGDKLCSDKARASTRRRRGRTARANSSQRQP